VRTCATYSSPIRTESTSACPPPVFWRAGRRGASGGGVRWGARLGGAGRNFRFFNFRVRWPRNSIRGQTIMAKQTAPLEAAVSPSSGRFQVVCGGDRTPWCGVRPSVHWQMRGRPSQHRAGLPPGAAHRREATVVFACCSPPPDSQPPPGLHDETARQPAHHSKTNELPRDGPQPSSAAACEAGRAVLGLTLRSSR